MNDETTNHTNPFIIHRSSFIIKKIMGARPKPPQALQRNLVYVLGGSGRRAIRYKHAQKPLLGL